MFKMFPNEYLVILSFVEGALFKSLKEACFKHILENDRGREKSIINKKHKNPVVLFERVVWTRAGGSKRQVG